MQRAHPIMLIDDDPDFLEAMPPLLAKALPFVPIETFGAASTAVTRLARRSYGVVISDVRMPDMDGWQVLQTVTTRFPETPVLLLSGYLDPAGVVRALDAGAYEVILKPLSPTLLAERIHHAIFLHRCHRQIKARQLSIHRGQMHVAAIQQIMANAQGNPIPVQNPLVAARLLESRQVQQGGLSLLSASLKTLESHIQRLQSQAARTAADVQSAYAHARLLSRRRAAGLY